MTDPARNEKVAYGSTIRMYVSRGPEEQDVKVPACIGYTLDEAKVLLGEKFTIQTMTEDSLEPEGTVIAQSISALLCLRKLTKMQGVFELKLEHLKPKSKYVKQIVSLGLPSGITQAIFSSAMIIVQSLTNSF